MLTALALIVAAFLALMDVSIVMDFRDMRKVTYYGGVRLWINWRAKRYAQDLLYAKQDREMARRSKNVNNTDYNKGLTMTLVVLMLVAAPAMFTMMVIAAVFFWVLYIVGILGIVWLAITIWPWYVWVIILAVLLCSVWFTRHITMSVLVYLFRELDRRLGPPPGNICYAHQAKTVLPMEMQMKSLENQEWRK